VRIRRLAAGREASAWAEASRCWVRTGWRVQLADVPVAEITRLASQTDASLVVLSSATTQAVRRGEEAAQEMTRAAPRLHVLTGRPGDTLTQLQQLARATSP
jgi:hypothetical protein